MTTNIQPRALVTGASSGIGMAFAERLAKDGYNLIIVARRRDRLEELAHRLQENQRVDVEALVADLSRHDSLRTVEKRIVEDSALEDVNLLTQIQEGERKFFELSRTGSVAKRYNSD
jgi:hypothetical protein